jgi:hypothetical protein
VVDTTTIRIGKGKNKSTYSGYKNYHGIKYQLICDNKSKINQELKILGDKAYVGLDKENVKTSNRNVFKYP